MWGSKQRTGLSFHKLMATWSHQPAKSKTVLLPGASERFWLRPRKPTQTPSPSPGSWALKMQWVARAHGVAGSRWGYEPSAKFLPLPCYIPSCNMFINHLRCRGCGYKQEFKLHVTLMRELMFQGGEEFVWGFAVDGAKIWTQVPASRDCLQLSKAKWEPGLHESEQQSINQ